MPVVHLVIHSGTYKVGAACSTDSIAARTARFLGSDYVVVGPFIVDDVFNGMDSSNAAVTNREAIGIRSEPETSMSERDKHYYRAMGHDPAKFENRKPEIYFDTPEPHSVSGSEIGRNELPVLNEVVTGEVDVSFEADRMAQDRTEIDDVEASEPVRQKIKHALKETKLTH